MHTPLVTIETLQGTKGCCVVLGFLLQLDGEKYFLEDLNAQIPLNFSFLNEKIVCRLVVRVDNSRKQVATAYRAITVLGYLPRESLLW